ncbi:MAG: hypothetical protein KF774_08605 [Planctomyces sp.]|nr:hypothetical protein [Planctomyces sp.]
MRWLTATLALVGTMGLAARPAVGQSEVDVQETQWGFDGTAVPGTFVPLSVLLRNNSASIATGELRLVRILGFSKPIDVPLAVEYEIPPHEARWFQLMPLLGRGQDIWELRWGDSPTEKAEAPAPRVANPAVVLLLNSGGLPRRVGTIKRFPTNLFPPSVTGTDALAAVALDEVPDLQGARLQAFQEWLRRGGRVFLLQDDAGRHPQFPDSLALLNTPQTDFRVGLGRVQRLAMTAREINPETLRTTMLGLPPQSESKRNAPAKSPFESTEGVQWDPHQPVLSDLERASRFHRRWWLIYPLAMMYVAWIFPGSYLVGRNAKRTAWFYAMFLAGAGLFSLAFMKLARVGAGEQNRMLSASVARLIGESTFDVTQWTALAEIPGAWRPLTHDASGRCYGAGAEYETVPGVARTGGDARLELDLPPGSTRGFVSRFRAEGPPIALQLDAFELTDGRLSGLSLTGQLPPGITMGHVAQGPRLYPLDVVGDRRLVAGTHRPLTTLTFITGLDDAAFQRTRFRVADEDATGPLDDTLRGLYRRLAGNAFGLSGKLAASACEPPPGTVRVLLFCIDDSRFQAQSDAYPDRRGCVLYVVDLLASGS